MQTYGNFISNQGFRPHLDSVDFIKFLRVSVIIALILAMAFSIRGNYKGLMQTLERDWLWLAVISLGITSTSSILSMITVIRIKGLKIVSRVLIGCVAIGLFYISTRLTFIGFVSSEKIQIINAIQENPELLAAKEELNQIIERQNIYGITQSEKMSLMTREKEQRQWIKELTQRLIVENRNRKSNMENAIGDEKKIAMTLFALGPELCIVVLSPLVVLLFGAGCGIGKKERDSEQKETEKIIYIPVPERVEKKGDEKGIVQNTNSKALEKRIIDNGNDNIKKAKDDWQPF